ncbi:MAG: hypothetical protein ABI367_11400 [Mucilaginibacter sp.]
MKRTFLTLAVIAIAHFSYAQWNGGPTGPIYYNGGNVGIGTTSPNSKLTVDVNLGNIGTGLEINNSATNNTAGRGSQLLFTGSGNANLANILVGTATASNNTGYLALQTSNAGTLSTSMFLDKSGNVGIGTTSLASQLEVFSGSNIPTVHAKNTLASGFSGTLLYGQSVQGNSTAYDLMGLYNNSSTLQYQVRGDGQVYMAGNVGIGVTAPQAKLNLISANDFTVNDILFTIDGIGQRRNGISNQYSSYAGGVNNNKMSFLVSDAGITSQTTVMTLQGDGNVGIGTISPDEKLTVNGIIHSTEVKVTNSVPTPDYVFEPDYKLEDLSEIKAYVDKNHHLPEIPSADQMEKEGISLGDMNMKLLKKVEELTLYVIDQNKQLQGQQKVNQSLQKQINRLNNRLKTSN